MAMHVDNPDPPEAAGPPIPEEYVELPEELWSATVRELDPRPVQAVLSQVRFYIAQVQRELETSTDTKKVVKMREALANAVNEMGPQKRYPPGLVADVPRPMIEALIPYLREYDEPGDRSVGIYPNGWCELAGELELALDGKLTCRKCGGEQYVWDEDVYREKFAALSAEDQRYNDCQDYGNVTCPECGGAGVVRIGGEK
jgi:hypothetical protein